MHDDMIGGVPQPHEDRVILRSFEKSVTVRELLHSSLDRLLDFMLEHKQPAGVVAITPLDTPEFDGGSIVLALDFELDEHNYEGLHDEDA